MIKELGPAGTDVVVPKRYYSAFTQTDLEATCLVHDVRRIVVVGQHTDCCVPHTSYDAFLRGLEVVVPADATAVLEPLSQQPIAARQQRALDYPPTFTGCLWCPPLTCLGRQATAGSPPRPDSSRCRAG